MFGAFQRDVFRRLPRLAMLTLLSLVLTTAVASAQYCTPDQCDECNLCQCILRCCHELPELWLINTRCAPRCRNLDNGFDCITYKRYDRKCCRWVRESLETFLAQEASMPTLFYSHGNSLNHKNAMKSCWQVYCKMRCCPGSKRLVFWSWPAERVFKTKRLQVRKMIAKNLRIKYVYAEYQGYYMAKLVNQMSLTQRVMMSGHSYGAITAAAAMHYIGGGCLRGLTLEGGEAVERPNLRAAMISGAFDHDMLIPGHRYGQTFVAGEKIFVTRNINDRTLKKWPNTSWCGRRAIGVLGVNANYLGEHRNKLCQLTMSADVGTSHYLKPHLKSTRFVSALCCLSFPACQQCSIAKADKTTNPEIDLELASDEQLAIEEEFVIDGSGIDFTLGEGFSDGDGDDVEFDEAKFDNLLVTPNDFALNDVFENEVFGVAGPGLLNGTQIADVTVNAKPQPGQSVARRNVSALPDIDERSPQEPVEMKPVVKKMQRAGGASKHSFGYRLGLGLALVLTGQFYVLFSKRVTTS